MFLWFIGTAIVSVWYVFRDPRFDYRLLILGAVLPLLDGLLGGARVMHSLLFSLVLLMLVMVVTLGRRPTRAVLLGLPIGALLHLVFDGAWADTDVFLWPLTGWSFDDAPLPEVARGWWSVVLELVGLAIVVWVWRTSRLGDPVRRRGFLVDGRLLPGTR
jgi:hypothetical protein